METYKQYKETYKLHEWNDIRKLTNIELLKFFLDYAFIINRKEAETHMLTLVATNYINGLFQQMWFEIFGKQAPIDPNFSALMGGFEAQDAVVNRELWKLSRKAVDMGLEKAFQIEDNDAVLKELEKSDQGKKWLKEYMAVPHGARMAM